MTDEDKKQLIEQMVNEQVERLEKLTDEEQRIEMQKIKESVKVLRYLNQLAKETKNAPR
jgi:hypothetical protein